MLNGAIERKRNVTDYATETPTPEKETERGSLYDMFAAPLVFAWDMDGKNIAEMFDVGKPAVAALSQMLNTDGTSRQLEQALTLPIRMASWSVEPTTATDQGTIFDDQVLTEVHEALAQPLADGGMATPMSEVIGQCTGAFVYRRAYFEKVFTTVNGKWRYSKLAHRPQDSCIMLRDAQNGDIRGFKQRVPLNTENPYIGPDGYVPITQQYAFVFVHGTHRDPVFGISDFDVPYQIYQTKMKVLFLWASFAEITGLPRVIFHGTSETNSKNAANIIAQLRSNGAAGIPESWGKQITQLQAGTNSTTYHTLIDYLDGQAADSILAGFTRLSSRSGGSGGGMGSGGASYSLSRDASGLFLRLMQGYANEMASSITNYVIRDLVKYNFGGKARVPKFKFGTLNQDDIALPVQMLQAMGTTPNLNPAIPTEFLTDLLMEVGTSFNLDLDKLRLAIAAKAEQNIQNATLEKQVQLAQLFATAQVGAEQVAAAKAQQQQEAAAQSAGTPAPTKQPPPAKPVPSTTQEK